MEQSNSGANRTLKEILVVAEDSGTLDLLAEHLADQSFRVFSAASLMEARQSIQEIPSLNSLILDHSLSDGMGLSIVEEARQRFPGINVILISGVSAELLQEQASRYHLDMVIHKPFNPKQLADILNTRFDMI